MQELTPSQKHFLKLLSAQIGKGHASHNTLSEALGSGKTNVQKYLTILANKGLIKRKMTHTCAEITPEGYSALAND